MTSLEAHYSARDIEARILAALRAAGLNPEERLSPEELGALDHFHTGGLRASRELLEVARIRAENRVLDIGAGLAGSARLLASAIGFGLGIALANFLLWLLPEVGFPVPQGPLVVLNRTLVASAVVGIGVTMLAAVHPAVRAARTPPIAAIGGLRTISAGRASWRRLLVGALIEARSCERFKLLSERLADPELRAFYRELMESEARHYRLFCSLCEELFGVKEARERLALRERSGITMCR